MRPLTFGVLVSVGPGSAEAIATASSEPDPPARQRVDRRLEGLMDLRSGSDLSEALRSMGFGARPMAADDDLDLALRQHDVDACLLALHGRAGGCGDVQSLLTMRAVPFCGPSGPAAALAFDKVRSRQVLAYHNLPVPAALALGGGRKASDKALELLGWPCVVKPRRGALGLGVAALIDPEQVEAAIGRAMDVDHEVVLERAVSGQEVQVVLLGDRVLGAMEVHRPSLQQLQPDGLAEADFACPPDLPRGRLDGIYNLARRAVAALGLHDGLSRVDVMVGDRYNELILEVEPLPPLHRDGVVARVAKAAGIAYEELVAALVDRLVLRAPSRSAGARPLLQ